MMGFLGVSQSHNIESRQYASSFKYPVPGASFNDQSYIPHPKKTFAPTWYHMF